MVNSIELLNIFQENNARYTLYEHPPMNNAEAAESIRHRVKGAICKSLFLTDNSGTYWLLTVPLDARVDLKKLAEKLGSGRLSFGEQEAMWDFLGVRPGSVTPLAVVNDVGNKVHLVLDKSLLGHEWINVHPLVNTMSMDVSPKEVVMFAEDYDHEPLFLTDIFTEQV